MDFEKFMRDIAKLEKAKEDLARVQDPEYIAVKAREIFGGLHIDLDTVVGGLINAL